MDYLQYDDGEYYHTDCLWCFKPYYKWITFNIEGAKFQIGLEIEVVLNLIINGLPSISLLFLHKAYLSLCFKPYYKWITFNILTEGLDIVFIIERISFYMVAKFEHFSVF